MTEDLIYKTVVVRRINNAKLLERLATVTCKGLLKSYTWVRTYDEDNANMRLRVEFVFDRSYLR